MSKHYRDVFGRAPTPLRKWVLRGAGWGLLAASFVAPTPGLWHLDRQCVLVRDGDRIGTCCGAGPDLQAGPAPLDGRRGAHAPIDNKEA